MTRYLARIATHRLDVCLLVRRLTTDTLEPNWNHRRQGANRNEGRDTTLGVHGEAAERWMWIPLQGRPERSATLQIRESSEPWPSDARPILVPT